MKLVITIDDDIYDDYLKRGATLPKYGTAIGSLYEALWNGVPLPKGHGRLIDADDLLDTNIDTFSQQTELKIKFAPTIIEADRGGVITNDE